MLDGDAAAQIMIGGFNAARHAYWSVSIGEARILATNAASASKAVRGRQGN